MTAAAPIPDPIHIETTPKPLQQYNQQKIYNFERLLTITASTKPSLSKKIKPNMHYKTHLFFLRFNSCIRVATCLAPVQPRGCPKAIAPPFGLTFSIGISNFLTQYEAWLANASFISYMSISSALKPKSLNL